MLEGGSQGRSAGLPAWKILIPDGDSPFALLVAQCLKMGDPNLRLDASYVDRRALTRFSRYVDKTFPLDPASLLEDLEAHLRKEKYDVLLPVSGPGMELVAKYAERFAALTQLAAVPMADQLAKVNDKWSFHMAMVEAGIPTPATALVDSFACLDGFAPDEPVILKPRSGSGGIGIHKFAHARDLRDKLGEFIRPGAPYIIQRYLDGHDIDRSVLCIAGKVVVSTVQQPALPQHGYAPSSALHFHRDHRVEELVDRMMSALGWNGIAHVDLRYSKADGSPMVIEMNPRYWSTLLGSLVAGINFPWTHVQAAKGFVGEAGNHGDCHYVGIKEWPQFRRRHGTPLSHTSLLFNLADPMAKLMKRFNPSSALGQGLA